jgi:hypothetical protein
VSLGLRVGDQFFGTLLRSIGDVQHGWHPVEIGFPNISIDDPQARISLPKRSNYNLLKKIL